MKEKDLENIIKQSVVSPPASFTGELMNKINAQHEIKTRTKPVIILLSLACLLIFVISFTFTLPEISYMNYTIRISPVIIKILSILFIFYEFGRLFDIYQKISAFSKNNT